MSILTVEAVYRDGVIKPITDICLQENEWIRLWIERSSVQRTRNVVRLGGIWKGCLTTANKAEDWVSDTIAAIRRESSRKIEQLAREIDEALPNA